MRAFAGILILTPLLLGTANVERTPEGTGDQPCPFSFDPNLVEGRLLGWLVLEAGQSMHHTRAWSDPDGDDAKVEIVRGPQDALLVNRPRIASYTILWTPRQPQITAIVLRITDNPRSGQPQSDTGTLLIQVLPPRRGLTASPCGGQPQ